MRWSMIVFAAALLAAAGLPLLSAEALNLEKARTMALAASKTLQKAGVAAEASALAEKAAFYDTLPSVSAGASAAFSYAASKTLAQMPSASLGVSASYVLWDGGAAACLAAIDRLATESARQSARGAYFDVLDAVDAAWYAALEAQASVEAAQSGIAAARQAMEIAKIKLEAGMITKVDGIQVESELATKETALSQAKRNLAVARARIASLTGTAASFELEKVDLARYDALIARAAGYGDAESEALASAVMKAARAANPALARCAALAEKAGRTVDQAAAGYSPTVSASFSHKLSLTAVTPYLDATSGSLSLSVNMSLDWWKTDNKVKAAEASARQASLDLEEQERSLGLEALTAVADCVAQARSVTSSRKAQEYAESNYGNVLELYRLSSKPVADLLDAEASVGSSTNTLIAARYAFLATLSALRSLGAFESEAALLALFP